jgi:putative N-acetylmannosamine-6-phosphate epimerase
MIIAFLVALVAVSIAYVVLLDRNLKRHSKHVERLLQYQHDPKVAALADMPSAELLYLPPEDDDAWNDQHRKAD